MVKIHLPPYRSIVVLLLLVITLQSAFCHQPGAEYTYLSLFMEPPREEKLKPDTNLQQLHEQFSPHSAPRPSRQTLRRLKSLLKNHELKEEELEDIDSEDTMKSMDENDEADDFLQSQSNSDEKEDKENEAKPVDANDLDRLSIASQTVRLFGKKSKKKRANVKSKVKNEKPNSKKKIVQEGNGFTGFSKEESKAIADENGEKIDRLTEMLKKIIKQYALRSIVDVPCRAHAHWIPNVVKKLAKEDKSFKYYCVDSDKAIIDELREAFDVKSNMKFVVKKFWKENLPKGDLVLSWDGLDNMKTQNVQKYLKRLSKASKIHRMVLLGSHSGSLEREGSSEQIKRFTSHGTPINFRKAPFYLRKPMRIIGDVSKGGNDKQLYIYSPADMYRRR